MTRCYTVGHSTRSLDELTRILRSRDVATLVDVRTVPRSRHNPQFDRDTLPEALEPAGIRYLHEPRLGGLRKPRTDSPNTGWRNAGFRGYADHMLGDAFASGLARLVDLASREIVAVMCAEAVPWKCHRSLISDALTVRGVEVRHLLGDDRDEPHRLTSFAKVDGVRLTYPAVPESRLPGLD